MLNDVQQFYRHLIDIFHFVRGVLLLMLALLVLCAAILTLAEGLAPSEALYLSGITALTVGYGDLSPVSSLGRVISIVIGFLGVVFVGIIVSVVNRALARMVEGKRALESLTNNNQS